MVKKATLLQLVPARYQINSIVELILVEEEHFNDAVGTRIKGGGVSCKLA